MAKQIPELTIIPTPTAGQESIIETVVARHDTYATSRMTLAQIFTLGSISGAIKSALDTLSSLIAGNTTSINTLSSTKLNIAGGTRTGLTANRALITDGTGVETYLTGTAAQVIGFDGAGKPIAVTPTVDVHGLTQKTTPVGADEVIISDSEASFANKRIALSQILAPIGGNGSDGALTISSGTTTLAFDSNGYVEKNYSSITITGGTLTFSGAPANGGVAVIKCSGRFVMSGGTISISGFGGAGAAAYTGSAPGTSGSGGYNVMKVVTSAGGVTGQNAGAGGAGGGGIGHFGGFLQGYCGAGGGAGGGQITGAAGGAGGGVLFLEVRESFNFSAGTITAAGLNGNSGSGAAAGSGGGGGGAIFIRCPNIAVNTGTINVNGGNGGDAVAGNFNNYSGGGAGGSYSAGGAGGAGGGGGNAGVAGTSNAYGSGGTGGAGAAGATPTGGGGGGGAGFYKIN